MSEKAFQRGYVCAVATLVKSHGADVEADELLRALGSINWRWIDQYDKDNLKEGGIILSRYGAKKGRP